MALDERYIPSKSLTSFLIDKETGEPLTGYIEFWNDNDRSTPKTVYQLVGSPPNYTYSSLPNPMSVVLGNPVNDNGDNVAIYYYPYDLAGDVENYYIKIYNDDAVLQEERQAWPDVSAADDPTKTENSITNELDNSQFVDVLFNPTYGMVISISGSVSKRAYAIAPYWDLVVSTNGSATVTINRTSLAGSLNIETNPPYTLDILTSGVNISELYLRQRLTNNPDIWANGYVAGYMVISSVDGTSHTIEIEYAPSIAPAPNTIVSGSTGASGYVPVSGTLQVPAGSNTDDSDTGYVDINVILPVTGHYSVTSLQVVGMKIDNQDVQYDEATSNRQRDGLFGYYNPLLQYKATGSYLVGWDFYRNPHQWGATIAMGAIGANKSKYLWDQTIGFQSANSGFTASRSNTGSLLLTANATTQIGIVQYLATNDSIEALLNKLSMMIRGYSSKVAGISGTVSLWYTTDASLPDINPGTSNSLVLTLDSNGKPATFNGAWTEVPRSSLGDARFTLNQIGAVNAFTEVQFSGWNLGNSSVAVSATFLAVVIGFESMATNDFVALHSVSLVPYEIGAIEIPLSYNEVIQKCQFFYEQSYYVGIPPGTVTEQGSELRLNTTSDNTGFNSAAWASAFDVKFKSLKRVTGYNFYLYSPLTGAVDEVGLYFLTGNTYSTRGGGAVATNPGDMPVSNFDLFWKNQDGIGFIQNNTTSQLIVAGGANQRQSFIRFHWFADARLGVV